LLDVRIACGGGELVRRPRVLPETDGAHRAERHDPRRSAVPFAHGIRVEYACRAGTTTRFFFGDALDCGVAMQDFCPDASPYVWWAAITPARIMGRSPWARSCQTLGDFTICVGTCLSGASTLMGRIPRVR
jgi:hypothetical protein